MLKDLTDTPTHLEKTRGLWLSVMPPVCVRIMIGFALCTCLYASKASAHDSYFEDISTTTVAGQYSASASKSHGSVGIGYRSGFLGILGVGGMLNLDYQFDISALDSRLGMDAWIAYWGLRADLLARYERMTQNIRFGGAIGAEMLVSPSMILYVGAKILPAVGSEGVLGLTWMFDGL